MIGVETFWDTTPPEAMNGDWMRPAVAANVRDGMSGICTMPAVKVAVTLVAELTVTLQVAPVPEQAPPQPENVDPELGEAVRATTVPVLTVAEQVEPQLIVPPVTMPDPEPVLETVSTEVVTIGWIVAA